MMEAEWNACTQPQLMLKFLRGKTNDRKLRLFAVACCRQIWHRISDKPVRKAIEIAERYCDGLATEEERHWAYEDALYYINMRDQAHESWAFIQIAAGADIFDPPEEFNFESDAAYIARAAAVSHWDDREKYESVVQSKTLRCMFGPLPLRSIPLDTIWLSTTVTQIAETIYQDSAFDRLPILADALEDADCTNADILNHCRQPGEHVRGCWVIDLLTGRK